VRSAITAGFLANNITLPLENAAGSSMRWLGSGAPFQPTGSGGVGGFGDLGMSGGSQGSGGLGLGFGGIGMLG
jgi:hypothetical protein